MSPPYPFTDADKAYIHEKWPTSMSVALIAAHIGCPPSTADRFARKHKLKRPPRGAGFSRGGKPGPKYHTSEEPPLPVKFANVVHWGRAEGHTIDRDIKPGLWRVNGGDAPLTPREVLQWANDKRTRTKPVALPLFDCDFSGLKRT